MTAKWECLKQRSELLIKPLLADEVASRRQEVGRRRLQLTQKFLVYLAPEQMANWIQVCVLWFVLEPFGHRQGKGEERC